MTRKSLKPQLNQIRAWVQQGRTDAWIAHQLEVTVQQIESFKSENGLAPAGPESATAAAVDLRDEDDALIAAELEAEQAKAAAEEAARAEEEAARRAAEPESEASDEAAGEATSSGGSRGRGSARGRGGRRGATFEGSFDHGEEGYGLWLDPSVADDPVYAEHWAGHRPIEVTIEEDRIVIRRTEVSDQ
jgi:hypothetical protein